MAEDQVKLMFASRCFSEGKTDVSVYESPSSVKTLLDEVPLAPGQSSAGGVVSVSPHTISPSSFLLLGRGCHPAEQKRVAERSLHFPILASNINRLPFSHPTSRRGSQLWSTLHIPSAFLFKALLS